MAQGMEEAPIADPPLLLNQLILHDGDMSSGTPKLMQPNLNQKRSASAKEGRCGAASRLSGRIPGPKGKRSIKEFLKRL